MTIEQELKNLIEDKFGSVRAFAMKNNMPVSSVHTILIRGIQNSRTSNVIKLAVALGISADALADGRIVPAANIGVDVAPSDVEDFVADVILYLRESEIVMIGGKRADDVAIQTMITTMQIGLELAKRHLSEPPTS